MSKPGSMQRQGGRVARFLNVLLAIVIVLLIVQNYQLKQKLPSPPPKPDIVALGERLPDLRLKNTQGQQVNIDFSDQSAASFTLLYILTTQCRACQETIPTWRKLDVKMRSQGLQSYFVVVNEGEDLTAYAEAKNISGKVYNPADGNTFSQDYKVVGVPMTLLLDSQGHVQFAHLGVLSRQHVKEVETVLEAGCKNPSDCTATP